MNDSTLLDYRIREASLKSDKTPAVFMLHGYGSNMDDLFSFAPHLPQNYTIISFQAPYLLPMGGNAWYEINFDENSDKWSNDEQALTSIEIVKGNILSLCKSHHLNKKTITLIGFSQGAILSWAIALNTTGFVRRIVALSGYVDDSLSDLPPKEVNFSAYASHGTQDPIIPVAWSRSSIVPLQKRFPSINYYEFPDGHTISQANFIKMLKWIEKT